MAADHAEANDVLTVGVTYTATDPEGGIVDPVPVGRRQPTCSS